MERGTVWIRLDREGECLNITVEDDGCGMQPEKLRELRYAMVRYDREDVASDPNWGIGVLNVYRRLRLFYGEKGGLEIDSVPDKGTTVRLRLVCTAGEEE